MKYNLHDIVKYLIVAGVVAFISLLFPSQRNYSVSYEVGQTWSSESLVAPFDFPLLKTEEELELESEKAKEELYAYFRINKESAGESLQDFDQLLDEQAAQITAVDSASDLNERVELYRQEGRRILSDLYDPGILQDNIPPEWNKGYIQLVDDNKAKLTPVNNLLNRDDANRKVSQMVYSSGLVDKGSMLTLIHDVIRPTIYFDQQLTNRSLQEMEKAISPNTGLVRKGEVVISEGDMITEELDRRVLSFKEQFEKSVGSGRSDWIVFGGYLLLTSLVIGVFLLYMVIHYKEIFRKYSSFVFMLIWPVIFSYLVFVIEGTENISTYLIPFCIVPIIVKNFYNDSLALFSHLVIVLIASFLSKLGYEFTFLQLLVGTVSVLTVKEIRIWSEFFLSIFYIVLAYSLGYLGLSLIQEGGFSNIDWSAYVWFFFNGILCLLAYPLIPLLEKIFGYVSAITLSELNDLTHPLLKDLSLKAPGTLQHSLQVSNLSEAAAKEIGANARLIKVGAMYHDIGKTTDSTLFIENQTGENPHEKLDEMESAKKIIAHVEDGVKMARKHRLPSVIIDFIKTHHGTTRVEYFYRTFMQKNPGREFDESLFQYPGPRPSTKEQAIMMIADSVEAASKALKQPTGIDIDGLVDGIIDQKIDMHQLDEAAISFAELASCRSIFKKMLRSIYHVRIEYPKPVSPAPNDKMQKTVSQGGEEDQAPDPS